MKSATCKYNSIWTNQSCRETQLEGYIMEHGTQFSQMKQDVMTLKVRDQMQDDSQEMRHTADNGYNTQKP